MWDGWLTKQLIWNNNLKHAGDYTEDKPVHIVIFFLISFRILHNPSTIAMCVLGGKLQY